MGKYNNVGNNSLFNGYFKEFYILLRKIPKTKMDALLKQYRIYLEKQKLVTRIFLWFTIIACIHNGFIVFEIYKMDFQIIEIMIGILVLFLLPCCIVIGVLLKCQFRLRGALKMVCKEEQLPVRKTRKEFNQYIKSTMGGYGI